MAMGMSNTSTTTTVENGNQVNNLAGVGNQEPSNNDDNSILDAISNELTDDNDTAVKQDDVNDDANDNVDDNDKQEDDIIEDDDAEVEIPEKFKTKDGNLNLKALSKYIKDSETYNTQLSQQKAELEKQQEELKSKVELAENLEKQQDEMAKKFGFQDFSAMQKRQQEIQYNNQLAQYCSNCYMDYVSLCENPNDVKDLLMRYSQNPTKELGDLIGEEFPPEVHIQVGEKIAEFKNQLAMYHQQQERIKNEALAKEHINNVVSNYGEWFKNKEFAQVYALAFQYLGTDLDPTKMFPAMQQLKDSWIREYQASLDAKKQNDNDIDTLQNLSPNGKAVQTQPKIVDIDKLSPAELDKAVGQLV